MTKRDPARDIQDKLRALGYLQAPEAEPSPAFRENRRQLVHVAVGLGALSLAFLPMWAVWLGGIFGVILNFLILPALKLDRPLLRPGERYISGFKLYPVAVLILVLVFPLPIAAAAWGILATGDAASNWIGRKYGRVRLPWHRQKSWAGLLAFFVVALPVAALMILWTQWGRASLYSAEPLLEGTSVWIAAGVGALVSAVLESLPIPIDDNVTVSIGSALAMQGWLLWGSSIGF
ncbi:MAG: hypothetical protein RL885_26055 [Planctomycetota bacterium]